MYVFSSNPNTKYWKFFRNYGGAYRLEKKIQEIKYSGDINPLGVHRNMRRCIPKVNSEALAW